MRSLRGLAGLAGLVLFGGIGVATADVLPACNPGVNCLVFNDFNVFSLPLLNAQSGNTSVPKPGDPFFFSSTFGQIQNDTIIGINNGQSTATGNPPGSVDGSYNTPSANNINTFSTLTPGTDPGGLSEFTGDNQSWDAKVPVLQTLAGGAGAPIIAFFAFNETGSGTGLDTTDLLIWASVTLHNYDANGVDTTPPVTFYLDADNSAGPPPSIAAADLPLADGSDNNGSNPGTTPGFGPWVYVHAGICIDGTGAFKGFPDVNGQCPAGQTVANQNNLGQNAAAFAINSPALDTAMASGNWNVFSVTWEMAYINGGGETAWIQPFVPSTSAPEPATLANIALALLALGFAVRRRRRA